MRKTLLTMTAAAAILSAPSLAPAQAMTVGTVAGIEAALADASALQDAAYVCRHRFYNSRRVCWWRPAFRHRGWRWRRRR
jgi:hypothetical protein